MVFRSRIVIVFIILAMVAGGVVTYTADAWTSYLFGNEETPNQGRVPGNQPTETPAFWETSGLTEEEINKIASTYSLIDKQFYKETDKQAIINGAINGMLQALEDPFTVYMDEEQAKHFNETVIESSFSGIGAEVTMEDGTVTVISPIKGSPAEKAGIHAKDKILSVNGEKLDGLTLNESVMKIRGPKGTQAKLKVQRAGTTNIIEIIVVRDDIDMETVYAEMMENQIGKIEIRTFAMNTAERFLEELENLEKQNMQALIIDVRNNPGGILPVVIELAEPFIKSGGIIVQTEERSGERHPEVSKGSGKEYPVVVLTNKGSASASEILAAAMQESVGSMVIGETTYGKGTVQTTFGTGAKDGSNIKMTISKWLTPDGNFIHGKGVEPDIIVEQPDFFKVAPITGETVLKYDDLGEDIKNLQLMLEGLGLRPERTDGYFSEQTKLAVKAFQQLHNIPVTGEVGEQTAMKLQQEIIKEMQKPENDKQLGKAVEHLMSLMK
jgi:carboxyl-terminal processing protease